MKKIITAGFAVAAAFTLAACGSAGGDRTSGSGKGADAHQDVSKVTIWHNADEVPNVATFCVGKYRFASTLTGGKAESSMLVRLPEEDAICSGAAQ